MPIDIMEIKHSSNPDMVNGNHPDYYYDTPEFYEYQTQFTLDNWHTYPGVWSL